MFLRHGASGTEVPIVFKGNSLMVHAKLRRVTESDPAGTQPGAQSSQVTCAQSSQVTGAQSSQVMGAQPEQIANVQTASSTGSQPGVQQYAQVRYTSARPSQELVDASWRAVAISCGEDSAITSSTQHC